MQDMVFPELDGEPLREDIIGKCWHYQHATVKELATHIRRVLANGSIEERKERGATNNEPAKDGRCYDMHQDHLTRESFPKRILSRSGEAWTSRHAFLREAKRTWVFFRLV